MKSLFLLALCIFATLAGIARNADGYILLPNNDTVRVTIKLPGGLFGGYNINKKLEVVDSSDKVTEYTPADLKGFGYTDKKGLHNYRTKPIQDSVGHPVYFLEVEVDGPTARVYSYWVLVGAGTMQSTEIYYTFEKADGSVLFLKNFDKLSTLQDKLKAFFANTPALQQFVDARFQERRHIQRDIKEIAEEVNK
jgi:hypothetical protein